jgi:hypothetical protein
MKKRVRTVLRTERLKLNSILLWGNGLLLWGLTGQPNPPYHTIPHRKWTPYLVGYGPMNRRT